MRHTIRQSGKPLCNIQPALANRFLNLSSLKWMESLLQLSLSFTLPGVRITFTACRATRTAKRCLLIFYNGKQSNAPKNMAVRFMICGEHQTNSIKKIACGEYSGSKKVWAG